MAPLRYTKLYVVKMQNELQPEDKIIGFDIMDENNQVGLLHRELVNDSTD